LLAWVVDVVTVSVIGVVEAVVVRVSRKVATLEKEAEEVSTVVGGMTEGVDFDVDFI